MPGHEDNAGSPHPPRLAPSPGLEGRAPTRRLPKHFLKPAELIIDSTARHVATILGSCVAITFFHPPTRHAGICHAMLPEPRTDPDDPIPESLRWRYVLHSVEELVLQFDRIRGAGRPDSVEVKLFGGANLLPARRHPGVAPNIGASNVAVARALLAEAGYPIVASDVGGPYGRKLLFNTRTGAVFVKLLNSR